MNVDNPAEMSNGDLEKDMEQRNKSSESKSTAAEGSLLTPQSDLHSKSKIKDDLKDNEERDLDDLSHSQLQETTGNEEDLDDLVHRKRLQTEETHNGNLPDPEAIPENWEEDDTEDKMSS